MSSSRSRAGFARRPSGGASPLEYTELLVNDLEEAAVSLRPQIADALDVLREAGAEVAFVTGSGPTAVGLFGDIVAADRAIRGAGPGVGGCDRHGFGRAAVTGLSR